MKTLQDLVKETDFSEVNKYLLKEEKIKCEDIYYRMFLGLPKVGEAVIYPVYNEKQKKLNFLFCFVSDCSDEEHLDNAKKINISKEKNLSIILGAVIDYKYLKNSKYSDITVPELLAELLRTILRR